MVCVCFLGFFFSLFAMSGMKGIAENEQVLIIYSVKIPFQ